MTKNNKKMMERRTLLTTTKESVSSEQEVEQEYTKSVLVFIGYNETTGDPMYIEPCVSNDNPNPYESNCTHVPTASPTAIDDKWGYNGEGNGKENYPFGEDDGRPGWSNSAGGEGDEGVWYEYECVDEYCNVHPPGSSSSSYGSGGSSSGGSHPREVAPKKVGHISIHVSQHHQHVHHRTINPSPILTNTKLVM